MFSTQQMKEIMKMHEESILKFVKDTVTLKFTFFLKKFFFHLYNSICNIL